MERCARAGPEESSCEARPEALQGLLGQAGMRSPERRPAPASISSARRAGRRVASDGQRPVRKTGRRPERVIARRAQSRAAAGEMSSGFSSSVTPLRPGWRSPPRETVEQSARAAARASKRRVPPPSGKRNRTPRPLRRKKRDLAKRRPRTRRGGGIGRNDERAVAAPHTAVREVHVDPRGIG
jgi:hypothetical protein